MDAPATACERLSQLLQARGETEGWVVHAQSCHLPAEPLAHFFDNAGSRRRLLWTRQSWTLALGQVWHWQGDGPAAAQAAAIAREQLLARCIVSGDAALAPQFLLAAAAWPEGERGQSWAGAAPGLSLSLPACLLHRDQDGNGVSIRAWHLSERAMSADQLPGAEPWPELGGRPYRQLAEDALVLLRSGALRKLVLARAEDAYVDTGLTDSLERLHESIDAEGTVYAWDIDSETSFCGASPELLFSLDGQRAAVMALAGSRPRDDTDPELDQALSEQLLESTKERKEHQLVVEHCAAILAPRCVGPLYLPPRPSLRQLRRVWHLETRLDVALHHSDPFDLLAALHPTPAVCGLPTVAASAWLRRHEGLQRGLYTGILGSIGPQQSRLIVALRGGLLRSAQARLFAGAGLVETSDAAAEEDETTLKLGTMRSAISRR